MTVELSLYDPTLIYAGQKQFDCGHAVINAFVHNSLKPQVKKSLSVAYVLTDAAQANRFARRKPCPRRLTLRSPLLT